MKGLIYKEFSVFYKSVDKKLLFIAGAAIVLLICNAGAYAGLLASIMLAITVGMQNIMCFAFDERSEWKKYQLAMPVSGFFAVSCKYISVLCTVCLSLLGSIFLNLLPLILFRSFDVSIWGLSILSAVIVPMIWTGVCLPITYWFGFQSAQIMGLFVFIPMFFLIKYFEDGPGFQAMTVFPPGCAAAACLGVIVFYGISLIISVAGYERKR
ncbi:MAG: ABC-2 transporter permease [Lachnospiraceae bacterium]|nr:ABC-2 transporter permease [Lachnospiraceae bacterium]